MSKKAVWLSDIEFIEMHSSDWERLESEAFEPDESAQAQLNENQQIVLDWLKVATTDNYKNPVLEGLFAVVGMVNDLHPHFDPEICKAYEALILEQEAQVLEVFAKWARNRRKRNEL
ncbi:hypothetical protein HRE96_08515 [Enterococcus faecalis]|nr:hypothetical protein [Enterococcus faecalis]